MMTPNASAHLHAYRAVDAALVAAYQEAQQKGYAFLPTGAGVVSVTVNPVCFSLAGIGVSRRDLVELIIASGGVNNA